MLIEIHEATVVDLDAMDTLMADMDRFYGNAELDSKEVRVRQIKEALFSRNSSSGLLLASLDSQPVGFATYSFAWPAVGLTRSMYLKELYISEPHKSAGIGTQIMKHICQLAVANNCSRVEWTTDLDNQSARGFYGALGVQVNAAKIFYRLSTSQIEALAKG